jgi:hypothetical protein
MRHLLVADEWLLRAITAEIIAYRAFKRPRRPTMALEIKGLKGNMLKVQQRIERLNQKAVAFDALGGSLEQGLDDITAQVKAHQEDMTFAATVLGNSTTLSEGQQKPPEQPTTQKPDLVLGEPKTESTATAEAPIGGFGGGR